MKWACCGVSEIEKMRMEQLQSVLGSGHELVFIEYKEGADWDKEFAAIPDLKHVRWGESVQVVVSKSWKIQSTWTALLGLSDGTILRDGRWWPLCASYEVICQRITSIGEGLDMHASAFISGSGAMARAAIAALFRSGFRKFRILATDDKEAEVLLHDISVKFFGADVEVVPPEKIVLLAGVSSLFFNTLTEAQAPDLVTEISYLNFMKRPGALMDSTVNDKQSLLLKEARESAIPTLDGWHLAARIDALWVEWAFGIKIDIAAYENLLRESHSKISTASPTKG
jgi:hypothetical protein